MREATRRPDAQADPEAPQSAGDADAAGGDGGDNQQQAARQQRAHKRRTAAADAEADAFNQRHASEVAEFNQLTKDGCLGEDGKLDAAAVKDWQRDHNVAPDGKVGPKTIAAAGGKPKNAQSDAQLAPLAGGGPPKAKGPLEEITAWLDPQTVMEMIRDFEKAAKTRLEAGGKEEQQGGAEDAKQDATGLASKVSVDQFVEAAKKIEAESEWKKLTPDQRAVHMVTAANRQLIAADVRPVGWTFGTDLSPANPASFGHDSWKMKLYKPLMAAKKLTPKASVDLADAVYHEARHAEQNYQIAQRLAGRGKSVEQISDETGIDLKTITEAHRHPIDDKAKGAPQAQALFDDKYGAGASHHADTEKEAAAKLSAYAKVQHRSEDPNASAEEREAAQKQLAAMKPEAIAAWQAYQALPTEKDALAVGNKVRSRMKDQ